MLLIMRTYKSSLHKPFPLILFNTLFSIINKNEVLLQHHLKHLNPVAVLPSGLFSMKLQTDLQGPLNYVARTMLKLFYLNLLVHWPCLYCLPAASKLLSIT